MNTLLIITIYDGEDGKIKHLETADEFSFTGTQLQVSQGGSGTYLPLEENDIIKIYFVGTGDENQEYIYSDHRLMKYQP